jgi:hypothetical protein
MNNINSAEDARPVCPRCQKADRVLLPGEPGLEAVATETEDWWTEPAKKGRALESHCGPFCDRCLRYLSVPV